MNERHDHDQTGCGPFDGQLRIADPGCDEPADDRRDDARHRWQAAGIGNRQAERQGEQKNQKSGGHIGLESSLPIEGLLRTWNFTGKSHNRFGG